MPEKKQIISQREIEKRLEELGREITNDYRDCDLVVLGILNGSFIFVADLIRRIDLDLKVDFMRLASYGDKTEGGEIRFTKDIELDLTGCDLLVVEDIIDTGKTIAHLKDHLTDHRPNSIKICTLINKQERRKIEITPDYTGFTVDQGFLVGYGLDHAERYRNLPDIYHLIKPKT